MTSARLTAPRPQPKNVFARPQRIYKTEKSAPPFLEN
jgi:hypothetical protein